MNITVNINCHTCEHSKVCKYKKDMENISKMSNIEVCETKRSKTQAFDIFKAKNLDLTIKCKHYESPTYTTLTGTGTTGSPYSPLYASSECSVANIDCVERDSDKIGAADFLRTMINHKE